MTRLIGRRFAQRRVPIGSDVVIAAFPIPRGGKLNSLFLDVSLSAVDGGAIEADKLVSYSVSAYVVPVPDPDTGVSYEAAWDQFIPKDATTGSLVDIDTAGTDTNPENEPGEPDVSEIFNMIGLQPREIFKRISYLTFATGMGPVGGTALDKWLPADHFTSKINRNVNCSMYSYVLVACSSPFMTATAGIWDVPTEQEWAMLQFLDIFIEQMFIASLNLEEAGAESPHVEAETFITELLEDTMFEETAASYHPIIWNVFCRSTFDISVPGRPSLKTLTSD